MNIDPQVGLLIAAFICMVLDIITGLIKGASTNSLDSQKMREGLWHKAGFIGLIALSYVLQVAETFADLGVELPAVTAVCVFVILTEAVSICENLCEVNPAIKESPIGRLFGHGNSNGE